MHQFQKYTSSRVSHKCWEHERGGGGISSKFDGGGGYGGSMGALNAVEKHLWRSLFDSNVAGYKPASLQIY